MTYKEIILEYLNKLEKDKSEFDIESDTLEIISYLDKYRLELEEKLYRK